MPALWCGRYCRALVKGLARTTNGKRNLTGNRIDETAAWKRALECAGNPHEEAGNYRAKQAGEYADEGRTL